MFGEFDNVFSCCLGSSKSADELYEKHVSDGTINDGIKTCRKCGREYQMMNLFGVLTATKMTNSCN